MPLIAGNEASDKHRMSGTLGISGTLEVYGPEGTNIGGPTIITRHTASFGDGWEQPMSGALIVSADLGLTAENPQQRHGAVMYLHSPHSICYLGFKNEDTVRADGLQGNPVTNTTNRGMFLGLKGPNFYIRNEIPHVVSGDDRGKIILNTQSNEMIVDDYGIKFGSHTSDNHQMTGSVGITNNLTVDGNVGIGTDSPNDPLDVVGNARISNHLAFNCAGTTDPTGTPPLVNHAHIYSKLVSGHAEMFVQDSNGNVTQISPHTPEGEWQYFSRNTRTGKVVRINMEKMIRRLEEITGESFMEEWYEDPNE